MVTLGHDAAVVDQSMSPELFMLMSVSSQLAAFMAIITLKP